ncbi:UDP-3-O-(3-hydroxymyristoyl)glucosamine N-acyltransferase [Rhodospirillales bacterium 47_12_T64]|nr:UDP-3-O-(3-hydroxymyristoyl)glucosamine N-acyltransferase [Rhodospirillales bacterium 47_12_T64]
MADPRFFYNAGPFTLKELCDFIGGELSENGNPDLLIHDVAALASAELDQISFLDNKKYVADLEKTNAGACIVDPKFASKAPESTTLILTSKPYKAYALIAQKFYPRQQADKANIHQTANIDESARIGKGCHISAGVCIGKNVEIGAECIIEPNVVIADGVKVGTKTLLGANSSLEYCFVGDNCQIHAGVRIGNRGFGFAMEPDGYVDVPQLGRVIVGNSVEIGANSTIDRGAGPDTVIGDGTKIDNLVQIGHNVQMGKQCVVVAQSGIAGSATLEDYVVMGAQSGVSGHIKMGAGVQIAGRAAVIKDVEPGQVVAGTPAMPIKEFFRLVAMWKKQLNTKKGK